MDRSSVLVKVGRRFMVPIFLFVALLLGGAMAACGGESSGGAGSDTDRETTERETGRDRSEATEEARDEPESTRTGILGQLGSQATEEPEATEEPDGAKPKLGQAVKGEKGGFVSVSAGRKHTCGVRTDGSVACWGDNYHGQATPPEGKFASVTAWHSHTCGVRADGTVACWGGMMKARPRRPKGSSPRSASAVLTPAV